MRKPDKPLLNPAKRGPAWPSWKCVAACRLGFDAETRRRGEQRGEEAKARGGSGFTRSPGGGARGERGGMKSELRSDASVRSPRISADSALSRFAFHHGVLRVFLRASAPPRQDSIRMHGESTFLAMAGQGGIAVGGITPDRNRAAAVWLWFVADNVRLAAENAVAVARELV